MGVPLSKQQHRRVINQIAHGYVQSAPKLLAPFIKMNGKS